ncbi:MAG: tyrosine--tRNA ligase [Treponema sp.]|nr:tyrosine--tRNA ligase [Treponema sp.]
MSLYEDLKWRGLIKDVAGEESELQKILDGKPFSFYWGTDPTADSLHIGHYSSLCMAKRLANAGHHPVLLCGGATGRIGDPRPTAEREIISEEVVNNNIKGLQAQVSKIVPSAEVVDNYDWLKDYTFLNFLRDVGKYINVNYMLDKDIIRRRLENGITYAEFSYMLMQGYDFVHLYQEKNCIMEVAGSDQWGNITTGVDLIRKMLDKPAYAFTMPLILDATGKKFGKSEGNALWLDKNKTSAYEIYQYLINSDDSKVIEYLKVFTFLSRAEIEKIEAEQKAAPETRIAQKTLAWEVVKDLHGKEEADNAVLVSQKLFAGDFKGLSVKDILSGMKGVPSFKFEGDKNIVDLLVDNKIASSKREAREFITGNAVSVNGETVNSLETVITKDMALEGKIIIIRRGKKKYFIAEV